LYLTAQSASDRAGWPPDERSLVGVDGFYVCPPKFDIMFQRMIAKKPSDPHLIVGFPSLHSALLSPKLKTRYVGARGYQSNSEIFTARPSVTDFNAASAIIRDANPSLPLGRFTAGSVNAAINADISAAYASI